MANDTVDSAALVDDPEARFDFLVEHDVLSVAPDDTVSATDEFHHTRDVYEDTYTDVTEEEFRQTVADLFDLTEDEAANTIEEYGLSRRGIATFLALRSHLDVSVSQDALLMLTGMATQVGAGSPVPGEIPELSDEDYESFLADHGDAVVFVFQHGCQPCEVMKEEIDEILGLLEDVAVAGVDGDEVADFRREFEVEAAPTTLVFVDGELAASERGGRTAIELEVLFAEHYDGIELES